MLAALSVLVTIMSCHSECGFAFSARILIAKKKETRAEQRLSRRSDVPKLSEKTLDLSVGPVPGNRVRLRAAADYGRERSQVH